MPETNVFISNYCVNMKDNGGGASNPELQKLTTAMGKITKAGMT